MVRHRHAAGLVIALVAACLPVALSGPAQAKLAPTVTLTTLTSKIDVGEQPTFRYSTTGVPSDGFVRLQLLEGNTWTNVEKRLPGTNKTVKAPAVNTPAKYTYRMRAFSNDGTKLAQTDHNHDVYAYKNILIEKLCPHTIGNPTGPRICKTVHVTVNGNQRDMHMALGTAVYPNFHSSAHYNRTSCRSAALVFTTKTSSVKSYLKFVQGTTSKVASTPANQLGHFNPTSLTSATLYFNASVQSTSNSVYIDGTMNCWTSTGTY